MLALIQSPSSVPNVSVYGPDHHFQGQWLDVESCYLISCILWSLISCILWSLSVDHYGGLRMEIGVL